MLNGDTIFDINLNDFSQPALVNEHSICRMALRTVENTERFGRVTLSDGTITAIQEKGMVEEIPVSCSDQCGKRNFFIATEKEHRHFFHCEKCHTFIKVPGCTAESMSRRIEKELGASVHRHVLYFTGVCAKCGGN